MLEDPEIRSLIKLLDDENEEIVSTVKQRLLEKGVGTIPLLEKALDSASGAVKERIKSIVAELAMSQAKSQFEDLARGSVSDIDLEEGLLLIARYGYPNEDLRWCSEALDGFSHELDSKLDAKDDPLEIISVVTTYFGGDKGFRGNLEDYYDPDNSYINRVLQRKIGLPISLSAIYLLVARRLNIPLQGVGMPGNFLLKYDIGSHEVFVDAFRGGRLLNRKDCREYLEVTGLGFKDEYLQTVSNRQILERVLRNLVVAYRQRGEKHRMAGLESLSQVLGSNLRS